MNDLLAKIAWFAVEVAKEMIAILAVPIGHLGAAMVSNADWLLQAATAAACAVIIFRVEPALNRMSRHTQLGVRLAFYWMAACSGFELAFIIAGRVPAIQEAAFASGMALVLMAERRLRALGGRSDRLEIP